MPKDIQVYATISKNKKIYIIKWGRKVYKNERELIGTFTDFISLNISFESMWNWFLKGFTEISQKINIHCDFDTLYLGRQIPTFIRIKCLQLRCPRPVYEIREQRRNCFIWRSFQASVVDEWISTERWRNDTDKGQLAEKNLCQRHFFLHRSLTDRPGIQPWPPWGKAGDQSPEPWLRSSGDDAMVTDVFRFHVSPWLWYSHLKLQGITTETTDRTVKTQPKTLE